MPHAARESEGSPLSPSQLAIWTGQQLYNRSPLYNMAFAFLLEGRIDARRFRQAFLRLVAGHDALRVVVATDRGLPRQRALALGAFLAEREVFTEVDLSGLSVPEEEGRRLAQQLCEQELDLSRVSFRTALIRLQPERYLWAFCQHHLLTDAWSVLLLFRRLAASYSSVGPDPEHGGSERSPKQPLPSYLQHLKGEAASSPDAAAVAHWQQRAGEDLQPPRLFGLPASQITGADGNEVGASRATASTRLSTRLSPERCAALRKLALDPEGRALTLDLGLFNLFATLLFALQYRLSGQRRLALGAPSHHRPTASSKETVGLFIEMLPVEVEVGRQDTWLQLLRKVQEESQRFLRYAAAGAAQTATSRSYHTVLNYIRGSFPDFGGLRTRAEWLHPGHHDAQHLLRLHVHDFHGSGELSLQLDCQHQAFSPWRRQHLMALVQRLLDSLLLDWRQPVQRAAILSAAERQQLVSAGRGVAGRGVAGRGVIRPREAGRSQHDESEVVLLPEALEATARSDPDRIALELGCGRGQAWWGISYGALVQAVRRLARHLSSSSGSGQEPAPRVALLMERSPEVVVAMLGALRAGGAYVPIDPDWPAARQRQILQQSGASLLLTQAHLVSRCDQLAEVVPMAVVSARGDLDLGAAGAPQPRRREGIDLPALDGRQPAYLLYTSGSTGQPKGVVVSHRSLAHYIAWACSYYGSELSLPLFSPLTFDLTVTSIYLPLSSGGTVVIYGPSSGQDPDQTGTEQEPGSAADLALLEVVAQNRVDLIKLTPSHLALLAGQDQCCSRVRQLILGGESLDWSLVAEVRRRFVSGLVVHNEYGPTEATVGCIVHTLHPDDGAGKQSTGSASVPVGLPIPGLSAHVLGPDLEPVPAGVPGELYLGGEGLAQGYAGQPALTAWSFVPDPESSDQEPGRRLYRSGDLARYTEHWPRNEHRPRHTAEASADQPSHLAESRPHSAPIPASALGPLEYLGRRDSQVKVRGVRVELGEIESVLASHRGVRACAVVLASSAVLDSSAALDRPRHPEPEALSTGVELGAAGRSDQVQPGLVTVPTSGHGRATSPRAKESQRAGAELGSCQRCGLQASYPGVRYDSDGVCQHCRAFDGYQERAESYFGTEQDLRAILDRRPARHTRASGDYDCLALLSGGKDSTYVLCRLVDMGYRVLAFTLDNGYLSEQAMANIRRVVESLGVDHEIATTPAMGQIFADSLARFSNVCQGCFKTIYTLSLKTARERGTPFIVTGLSRGQLFETRLAPELFSELDLEPQRIDQAVLEARKAYHRAPDAVSRLLDVSMFEDDRIFEQVQFVDFYRYCAVELDEVLRYLKERVPWIRPTDTGRSTNCLINDVGIYVHRKERGFHNYALPYSWDVRLGHKTRSAAVEELDDQIDEAYVHRVLGELGHELRETSSAEHASTAGLSGRHRPLASTQRLVAFYVGFDESQDDDVQGARSEPDQILDYLRKQLPTYLCPSRIERLESLPTTEHGKVDRRKLQERAAMALAGVRGDGAAGSVVRDNGAGRAGRRQPYLAPRNEIERSLVQIWTKVLGQVEIGVRDSFFELSGDSILAIQVVARARRRGLIFSPGQLFDSRTVENLANHCKRAQPAQERAEQSTASVSLTPAQHWLLDQAQLQRWSHLLWLELEPLDRSEEAAIQAMEQALGQLTQQHEALRLRFESRDGAWRCTCEDSAPSSLHVARWESKSSGEADEPSHRRQLLEESLLSELEPARAAMLNAALVLQPSRSPRLLLAVHHLAVDAVSWPVILEDLMSAFRRSLSSAGREAGGQPSKEGERHKASPPLGRQAEAEPFHPTTSLAHWSAALRRTSTAATTAAEEAHWGRCLQQPWGLIPTLETGSDGWGRMGDSESLSLSLDSQSTANLLGEATKAGRVRVQELLVAALGLTLADWTGSPSVGFFLEGHGRELPLQADSVGKHEGPDQDGLDPSRIVGWLTALYPLDLSVALGSPNGHTDPGEVIRIAKEQLRQVPGGGRGYGLLRYLSGQAVDHGSVDPDSAIQDSASHRLRGLEQAQRGASQLLFNYLGRETALVPRDSGLRLLQPLQLRRDQNLRRPFLIELNASLRGSGVEERLHLDWDFSPRHLARATVEGQASAFLGHLRRLILHCVEARGQASSFSSTDFPLARLDRGKLDKLSAVLGRRRST